MLYNDLLRHKEYYKNTIIDWESNERYKNIINIYKKRGATETCLRGKVAFWSSGNGETRCGIILLQSKNKNRFRVTGYDHMSFIPEKILTYEKALEYTESIDKAIFLNKVKREALQDEFNNELKRINEEFSHTDQ